MKKMNKYEAVSESIGFIVLFSLIITGIALVTMYGYPELMKNQISADERNMEQNMITLQNDIKLLTYNNIPYKDTSLRVSGGSLTVFDSPQQYFKITYDNETGFPTSLTRTLGEMRYVSEEGSAVISLENGAVVERQELTAGSFMLAEPRWFFDDDTNTLVIFLIDIDSGGKIYSLTNIGTISLARTEEPSVIDIPYSPGEEVFIEYVVNGSEHDFSTAWSTYLNSSSIVDGGLEDQSVPGHLKYKIDNVNRLVIKQYNITVLGI